MVCMQSLAMAYLHTLAQDASQMQQSQTAIYKAIVKDFESNPVQLVSSVAVFAKHNQIRN